MVKSPKFRLIKDDLKKWAKNALLFAAPAILMYLGSVAVDAPKTSWGIVLLYSANCLTDLLKKFVKENKYK